MIQREAVIVLGHGSRSEEATRQFHEIVDMLRVQTDAPVLPAFMELAEPSFADAVAEAVRLGVRHVLVLPLFLFVGMHMKHDIPEMIVEAGEANPQLSFELRAPLGADPRIADILLARLRADVPPREA